MDPSCHHHTEQNLWTEPETGRSRRTSQTGCRSRRCRRIVCLLWRQPWRVGAVVLVLSRESWGSSRFPSEWPVGTCPAAREKQCLIRCKRHLGACWYIIPSSDSRFQSQEETDAVTSPNFILFAVLFKVKRRFLDLELWRKQDFRNVHFLSMNITDIFTKTCWYMNVKGRYGAAGAVWDRLAVPFRVLLWWRHLSQNVNVWLKFFFFSKSFKKGFWFLLSLNLTVTFNDIKLQSWTRWVSQLSNAACFAP